MPSMHLQYVFDGAPFADILVSNSVFILGALITWKTHRKLMAHVHLRALGQVEQRSFTRRTYHL